MGKKRDDLSRAGGKTKAEEVRMELRRETEPFVPGDGTLGEELPETAYGAGRAERRAPGQEVRDTRAGQFAQSPQSGIREHSTYPERPYGPDVEPGYADRAGPGPSFARSGAVSGNVIGSPGFPSDTRIVHGRDDRERSPEEIRAEIDRTRADMTRTIDALKEQLAPDHLKEMAQDRLHQVKEMAQDRLHQVEDQAREKIREATIGRVKNMARHTADRMSGTARHYGSELMNSKAGRTISDNPIPAVLTGIGLGWLLMASRKSGRSGRSYYGGAFRSPYEYSTYYAGMPRMERGSWRSTGGGYRNLEEEGLGEGAWDRTSDTGERFRDRAADMYEGGREAVSDMGDRVRGTASDLADRASRTVGQVRDTASDYIDQAAETGSRFAEQARDTAYQYANQARDVTSHYADQARDLTSRYAHQARDLTSRYAGQAQEQARQAMYAGRRMMHENPALIGIAAVAVGALVGFIVPESRWEDRTMGGTRDNLLRRARDTSQDYLEQARDVAQETGQRVMGEFQEAGQRVMGEVQGQFQQVQERFQEGFQEGQQGQQGRQEQPQSRGGQSRQDQSGQRR